MHASRPQPLVVGADTTEPVASPAGIAELTEGPYRVRFARTREDLERALRLRFEVFNAELGEGLEESWSTGLDRDRFDEVCHHLLLEERASGRLVGTYRMQTCAMARTGLGFYCAQEFELGTLPEGLLAASIELGRACIVREQRNSLALFALWRGLAAYLTWSGTQHLFGCCSLTTQDPRQGAGMMRRLERGGYVSERYSVLPVASCACPLGEGEPEDVEVPRLFATYLRYGAKVLGPPAIDREFGTIDFFILLDIGGLGARVRDMFFGGLGGGEAPAGS